jgi:hypothetical protein
MLQVHLILTYFCCRFFHLPSHPFWSRCLVGCCCCIWRFLLWQLELLHFQQSFLSITVFPVGNSRSSVCVSFSSHYLFPPNPLSDRSCVLRDRYDLTENDLFAIWASDGVWEFLQNEDVAKILATHTPNWDAAIGAVIEVLEPNGAGDGVGWGQMVKGNGSTSSSEYYHQISGRVV